MLAIKNLSKRKQNQVYTQLSKVKIKVSNRYKTYQKKKATIKRKYKKPETIKAKAELLLAETRKTISLDYVDYQDKKTTIVYKDKFSAKLFRTKTDLNTKTKYYRSKNNIDNGKIDILELIRKNKNIKYILVDYTIIHKETGSIIIVSDSFSTEGFLKVQNDDLFQMLIKKSKKWDGGYKLEDYDLKYYTIRAIYELPESKKGKVHRDYSKGKSK